MCLEKIIRPINLDFLSRDPTQQADIISKSITTRRWTSLYKLKSIYLQKITADSEKLMMANAIRLYGIFILLLFVIINTRCSSIKRMPAGQEIEKYKIQDVQDTALKIHNLRLELTQTQRLLSKLKKEYSTTSGLNSATQRAQDLEKQIDALETKISQTNSQIFNLSQTNDYASPGPYVWNGENFIYKERLTLYGTENFDLKNGEIDRYFVLTGHHIDNSTLILENRIKPKHEPTDDEKSNFEFKAKLECDEPFDFQRSLRKTKKQIKSIEFDWFNNNWNGQRLEVKLSKKMNSCTLRFKNRFEKKYTHGVKLVPEERAFPFLYKFNNAIDACTLYNLDIKKGPVEFFLAANLDFSSCQQEVNNINALTEPINAFNQKIIALLGKPLPKDVIENQKIDYQIDFSNAPKLDFIYISSLNFNHDFYGVYLSRLLMYHAQKGTYIRILTPQPTLSKKTEKLLIQMEKTSANFKIIRWKFDDDMYTFGSLVNPLHRVAHTKIFLTYSKNNPQNSVMITGGRNIRDSYLFKKIPDYSKWPELIQYQKKEEPFIYYEDLEVKITGSAFVERMIPQVLSLMTAHEGDMSIRPTAINFILKDKNNNIVEKYFNLAQQQNYAKHILSVPFADNYQLEKMYVQLIDSAQRSILLSSPYFRPPVSIEEALERAASRGVKITLLTRIKLAGDDIPEIAEEVNKAGVNQFYKKMNIYEWTHKESILHTKLVVIDDILSFVTSVNLNLRSFIHDQENGVLILGRQAAEELAEAYAYYKSNSEPITQEKHIPMLKGWIIDLTDYFF